MLVILLMPVRKNLQFHQKSRNSQTDNNMAVNSNSFSSGWANAFLLIIIILPNENNKFFSFVFLWI